MRIKLTLLTLFHTVLLFSQTADVTKGCAPFEVKFTPPAGATTFFWDFKDGGSSILSNPSNIYTTPGTYDVEFRATQAGPIVGTVTITVFPKPVVGITAVPESGCIPLNVQFTDTTTLAGDIQVLSRVWDFGTGASGGGISPSHVYNSVGNFTVSLQLNTNYSTCNVTQVFPNLIKTGIKPTVNFTTVPAPPVACDPPLNVSFTNTTSGGSGTLTYQWTFGNGNTSNLVDPPAQVYTMIGTYTVTLVATDAIGCSASATRAVNIGKPTVSFDIPDTLCLNEAVLINNTSTTGNYSWNFGPNGVPLGSTLKNPTVAFTATGTQNITLTVTTGGSCSGTLTKPVYVDAADAAFTVVPSYACTDPTLFSFNPNSSVANQWEWTFSDGSTANLQQPTFLWTSPDTTGYTHLGLWLDTVVLKITNPSGCMAEFMLVDSIWRPNARFVPNQQDGCAPLSVIFADSSISNETIVEWTWLFDDGSAPLVNNTNDPVNHTFNNPGEYEVKLVIRNSAGCIDTSYVILIEVGEPITGDFTADKFEVCPGDSVQFTNLTNDPRVDAWHFSSESDRLWHCFQDENPIWQYNSEAGPMDVSLTTEYNGCFFTVTKNDFIQVKGPIAQLHYKTTCDNTLEFEFTDESYDATQLTWYLGDGDSSIVANFTHTYAAAGAYTVVLKAENPATGCPISYDTAVVYPTQLLAFCEIPDTICGGTPLLLDGRESVDVNAVCYKGYTWYFSWQRPIRTDKDTLNITPGPSGDQYIWLEVEDINGCKDTLKQDVVIYNRYPEITVSDDTICIPGTVTFTDKSTADLQIVSWMWDFGDGNTSTEQNPTHTYTTPPPNGQFFEVTLEIRDAFDCPGYAAIQVNVYEPVSTILPTPSPPNICAGESIDFDATDFTAGGSNLSWSWNFGNGQTAMSKMATATYLNAGQFTVKLDFTEVATGCKGSTTLPVNVQGYPTASFTSNVDNLSIICYPQIMDFKNTSTAGSPITSYMWTMSNGLTGTAKDISTVFPKGTYTVTMVAATSFGCADTVTRSFTVVGPEGSFDLDKTEICRGGTISVSLKDTVSISSWSWSFGDGSLAGKISPAMHTYSANFKPANGTTVIKLVLKGEDDACSITVEKTLNFSKVKADFDADAAGCAGASVLFTNTSTQADLSSWSFGDGGTSQLLNPDHIYNQTGNYQVKLVITDLPLGCLDSITKTVTIGGLNLQVKGDTICPGDTARLELLTMVDDATYIWSPTNLVLNPKNAPVVFAVPTQTTTFTLKVVDADGCQDEVTTTVVIPATYTGTQDLDTLVAKGEQVTLDVTPDPNYDFKWEPQQPGPPGDPYTTPPLDTSVTYTLTVADKLGCFEEVYTYAILVIPERVDIPNAFTPNGDGTNDKFVIVPDGESGLVKIRTLKVYSRWGQLVYEGAGTAADTGWDGRVDGKDAPSDVYVYVVELEYLTGRTESRKGDVTLLR